jgi:putative cell wall-binding protein
VPRRSPSSGGPAAVSANVEAQITALGFTVNRLAGQDRFGTAEAVVAAGEVAAAGNTGVASNVGIVASGISTVDALAVGPLAYKGRHPIFLTRAAALPASTLAAMRTAGVTSVYIVGGEAVVSAAVRTQLTAAGITVVDRLAGQTRSGTSAAIANAIIGGTFGFTNTTFNVASGANDGVDALSGAALSGLQNRALLVTDTATNAGQVITFATARAATLNAPGIIFGGPAAISVAVETAIETAGGGTGATNNQAFPVTVSGGNNVFLGGDVASRTRTYTATVPAGTSVDIQLFAADNVRVAANGAVTFVDANGDNLADPGDTTGATITAVNGAPGATGNAVVSNGTVTFTVTGTAAVNVVPVIFADANNDNRLNLVAPTTANNDPKAPSEAFAIGAVTNVLPALGSFGNPGVNGGAVTLVTAPAGGGFFTTGTNTFTFDTNDVFQFQGVGITQAQFESLLGQGATVIVNFNPSAAGVSTFNVQTSALTAATNVSFAVRNLDAGATANDVQVTYTRPANNAAGVTYTLQRRASTGADADFVTVTTATQAAGTGTGVFVFTDSNVPNGTYVYRVVATNPVTGATAPAANTGTVTVPGATDTTRPTIAFSRLTTSAGLGGTFDAGDVLTIVANEPLRAVAAGNLLRLRDEDGTVADIINGTNATFSLNTAATVAGGVSREAGTVLTVTLTGTPAAAGAVGTIAGLQVPGTVIDASGVADVGGNILNLASGDVTVEAGSIEGVAVATVASVAPATGVTTGGTSVTITGTGFSGATGVTFGGAPGTAFTVVSPTQITVTTPAGTAGPQSVVVQSPNGNVTTAGGFTYTAPA